jgi:titin
MKWDGAGRSAAAASAAVSVQARHRTYAAVDRRRALAAVPIAASGASLPSPAGPGATACLVTTQADSGAGSLRQCLKSAAAGTTITFDPAVFPPAAPVTISLASPLPAITVDGLSVDASNAGVKLDGTSTFGASGLVIDGAGEVKILGLQILGFANYGVALVRGAHNCTIGGPRTAGQANVVSGNGHAGILLSDPTTTGNRIIGNFLGTDASGALARGNDSGLLILYGAHSNDIGGVGAEEGNLISGNLGPGIHMEGLGVSANQVLGNRIGTDRTGTQPLPNQEDGVVIMNGASANDVGGTTPGAGNVISGNHWTGVFLQDSDTTGNRVLGNLIGMDRTGAIVLANGDVGIVMALGANNTEVGGETPAARNVVSGNGSHGIMLQNAGTDANHILGNYIGTDAGGSRAMPNHDTGVFIGFAASDNMVGGQQPGQGNLIIGGGGGGGVFLQEPNTTGNQVAGNLIGSDLTGSVGLTNYGAGVVIKGGASGNVIGGDTPGARNLISGNAESGVSIEDAGTSNNQVKGNYIGTDLAGAAPVGNGRDGVIVLNGASGNVIGGSAPGTRNLISGNGLYGVQLQDSGTTANVVQGNYIGTDVTGVKAVANAEHGVVIGFGASDNLVGGGTPGAGNVISGNSGIGVDITRQAGNPETTGNRVLGNLIGIDATGKHALGNGTFGLLIGFGASSNTVGGETSGAGNVIGGNLYCGVWLKDNGTSANRVVGNWIGTDTTGGVRLPNGDAGVCFAFGSDGNVVGPGNRILYNGAGVRFYAPTSANNTVTRSLIHDNALAPILYEDMPAPLPPATLTQYSERDQTLNGRTCPGCRVEVFANPGPQPAGTVYMASGTADAQGNFTIALGRAPDLHFLSTTSTNLQGATSEFSQGLNTAVVKIYLPLTVR